MKKTFFLAALFVQFLVLFCFVACGERIGFKEFIQFQAAGDTSKKFTYNPSAKGNGDTFYVPSGRLIICTVAVYNKNNLEVSVDISLDEPNDIAFFETDREPKFHATAVFNEDNPIVFSFQLKENADVNDSLPTGAAIPITVELKKSDGNVFSLKQFTICCNTPPDPPMITGANGCDVFTITLPVGSKNEDIVAVQYDIHFPDTNRTLTGTEFVGSTTTPHYITVRNSIEHTAGYALADAQGRRTLTVTAIDKVGLESEPITSEEVSYYYEFTVSFDSQGGSPVSSQIVQAGEEVPPPMPPTKDGYTFGGWYTEAACQNVWNFDTDTVNNKDITLYAKWVEGSGSGLPSGSGTIPADVIYVFTVNQTGLHVTFEIREKDSGFGDLFSYIIQDTDTLSIELYQNGVSLKDLGDGIGIKTLTNMTVYPEINVPSDLPSGTYEVLMKLIKQYGSTSLTYSAWGTVTK